MYQVYLHSFADGNGDGVGDLPGPRSRLGYLRDLGVDGLWITPWYRSPFVDGAPVTWTGSQVPSTCTSPLGAFIQPVGGVTWTCGRSGAEDASTVSRGRASCGAAGRAAPCG